MNEKLTEFGQFINLYEKFVSYLESMIEYNNNNTMFKLGSVYDTENILSPMIYPSITIKLNDILFVDSGGSGEDFDIGRVNVTFGIGYHLGSIDDYKEDKDSIRIMDIFIRYLFKNPRIYGSWIFNNNPAVFNDFLFEDTNSYGILFIITLSGFYSVN